MSVPKQNITFNKEMLERASEIIGRNHLEARWVIGKRPETWDDATFQTFAVNWGTPAKPVPVIVVPWAADAVSHRGLSAKSFFEAAVVRVDIDYLQGGMPLPAHRLEFAYDDVVGLQVRGEKRSGDPKCIFLTCTDPNWEALLEKELGKLCRIVYGDVTCNQWDNIADCDNRI